MWWTLFVLPSFYGICVEVLIHFSDLSYLSLVKSIVLDLSQKSAIESPFVAIVEIVKDSVESLNRGSLIEIFHTSFVETVHTNYHVVVVSKLSNVILWYKGGTIGTVNENVVSHVASKEMLLSVVADIYNL